jgi:hypothetical protein
MFHTEHYDAQTFQKVTKSGIHWSEAVEILKEFFLKRPKLTFVTLSCVKKGDVWKDGVCSLSHMHIKHSIL